MLPIVWHRKVTSGTPNPIENSGTITVARTSERILGLTAAHVARGLQEAQQRDTLTVQLLNTEVEGLDLIAVSDRLDLATFVISDQTLKNCGKQISPISMLDNHEPQEGRAIMLAGYPGLTRHPAPPQTINWGMFSALGIARRVTDEQITWLAERDFALPHPEIPDLPPQADLGGISGGPLVGWFEKATTGIAYGSLVAIISQANANLENIVAKRTHFIRADGSIREP